MVYILHIYQREREREKERKREREKERKRERKRERDIICRHERIRNKGNYNKYQHRGH